MSNTIEVSHLVIEVNSMLQRSTCSKDERRGMIAVLEHVLHMTNNYKGFGFLDSAGVKNEYTPEVSTEDDTRRFYNLE